MTDRYDQDRSIVEGYYEIDEQSPDGRTLLSYLTKPFSLDRKSPEFHSRQDQWQTIEIANIFNDFGYVIDAVEFDNPNPAPHKLSNYDVLFGFEPNFKRFAECMSKETTKIYYAIGAHWSWRNPAEFQRLDRLEERRGIRLSPERTLPETNAEELADAIIVTGDHYINGNEFIANTYRKAVEDIPIYHVRVSCFDFLECNIEQKDYEDARNNFMWFGGSGLVLKGLDLALEAFSQLKEQHLYVCGPVTSNEEFIEAYHEELFHTNNIHLMGYVNVTSQDFRELTQKCAYVINPSASGVAIPGALITCMHSGVVPIFTTEFEAPSVNWGIQLPDTKIDTIIKIVEKTSNVSSDKCKNMSFKACEKAQRNYTRETYSDDLSEALQSILHQK